VTTRPDTSRFTLTQKSGRVAQFVTDAQLKCGSILPRRLEPHPDTPGWCSPMIDGAFSCFCYYVLNLLSWPRRKSRRITFKSGNFSPLMGIPSARPALNAPEECVRKETTCFGGTVYKSSLTKRIDPLEPNAVIALLPRMPFGFPNAHDAFAISSKIKNRLRGHPLKIHICRSGLVRSIIQILQHFATPPLPLRKNRSVLRHL
jgi:hypothetical protein